MKRSGNVKSGIQVGDIMTRNFVSVRPDTNLRECAKEMIKKLLEYMLNICLGSPANVISIE